MADLPDTPTLQGDGSNGDFDNKNNKRQRQQLDEDDDDEDGKGRERRKIDIKFIQDKSRRHITFSKRKAGIMKKVGYRRRCYLRSSTATMVLPSPARTFANDGIGVRALSPDRHSSTVVGRVRDRSRLHLHDTEAPASRHES